MRTYVIARMYAGTYLNEHIGGEAINLLHDDNGNNYVFVGPYGFVDAKYNDSVEGIILTRLTKEGCFEILGVAKVGKGDQVTYQKGNTLKQRFENGKAGIARFAADHNIRYGGVSLREINGGSFFGADITFKSRSLLLPKEELFITDSHTKDYVVEGSKTVNLVDKRFPKQSLHSYITDADNPDAFKEITKLINDESLWEKDRINKIEEGRIVDKHFNFLDVIHKGYDELAYSNLFAYIFKTYPEMFVKFAKQVLGVNVSKPFLVFREKANIDIWVEDDKNIIVIENKIKSGINGVSSRHDFSEKGLIQSQLLKYHEYAEREKGEKNTYYYIFVPNYNKIDLKKYSGSQHEHEVRYSDIYGFVSKVKNNVPDFVEFVNALNKNNKDREVDYAEVMAIRFLDKINNLKKK